MDKDEARCHWDTYNMLCGELLGRGMSRTVYDSPLHSGWAVKVENSGNKFQNAHEWEVWWTVSETKWAKWFAPCCHISGEGRILIQEKTYPLPPDELPKVVPAFFTDLKRSNWGWLPKDNKGNGKGRIVCHDYGVNLLMTTGLTSRMKKADWRDD